MDASTARELTVDLSQLTGILAIILSLVALGVTVIGFFASLKFYRAGSTLQQLANDALIKIEEKASSIQLQVGGMFEKTLDAAIANKEELSDNFEAINEQLKTMGGEIVNAAQQEIGSAGAKEREKLKRVVESELNDVRRLVETTRASAEESLSEPCSIGLELAGSTPSHRVLRLLAKADDWVPASDIRERFGLSYYTASMLLERLCRSSQVVKKKEGKMSWYRLARSSSKDQ